jgi:hypothetical protein
MRKLLLLAILTASALAQCKPPNYCARTDLNTVTLPAVPPQAGPNVCTAGILPQCGNLLGIGATFPDPNFGSMIYRVTDQSINDPTTGQPNQSNVTTCSGSAETNAFSQDSSMIMLCMGNSGVPYPMNFGPPTGVVSTRMYTTTDSSTHGLQYNGLTFIGWGFTSAHKHLAYFLNSTAVQSYDYTGNTPSGTPPSPTSIVDFKTSANCLGGSYVVSGAAPAGTDQSDDEIVIAFANGGSGQDSAGATKIGVYKQSTGKCKMLDLSTMAVTADSGFGPSGSIPSPPCTTVWHNAQIFKIGSAQGAVRITPTNGTCSNIPLIWVYGSTTLAGSVYACCTSPQYGGHNANGLLVTEQNPGNSIPNFMVVCSIAGGCPTMTGITHAFPAGGYPTGMDQHFSWNVLHDSWPILSSSFVAGTATPAEAWMFEILGWQPTLGLNPYRFASTYCDSRSSEFQTSQCIGVGSQDGQWFLFNSNWLGTLGGVNGASTCVIGGSPECRGDVFAVQLFPAAGPAPSPAIFAQSPQGPLIGCQTPTLGTNTLCSGPDGWYAAAGAGALARLGAAAGPMVPPTITCSGETVTAKGGIVLNGCH